MKGVYGTVIICAAVLAVALASPIMYVRNDHNIFEPDMVPVSSTVLPLSIYNNALNEPFDLPRVGRHHSDMRPKGTIKLVTVINDKE